MDVAVKTKISWFMMTFLAPSMCYAICTPTELVTDLESAKYVGVATVTSSKIIHVDQLQHTKYFTIKHDFHIKNILKRRERAHAPRAIITRARYRDPLKRKFSHPEGIRLQPGDSVLLVSNGDKSIEVSLCSPSRLIVENSDVVKKAMEILKEKQ